MTNVARIAALLVLFSVPSSSDAQVPVIYSTDLFHPHDDPDDHYDLATLFALPELDVRGVIIDMVNIHEKRSYQQSGKKPGLVALQQMKRLTGKEPPVVTGLEHPLTSPDDPATDQAAGSQGGVELILATLRQSDEKVCLFTVGSLVDVAAAYNREPDLMRQKVRAVYVNAGTGPDGFQEEWNVRLDRNAYQRVLLSDLPIQWYPCFGRDGYLSHFRIDQADVLAGATAPLRAFFAYALRRSQDEPISFLSGDYPPPTGPRNMWCTASFVELAGRKIYRTDNGYEALRQPPRADAKPVECYRMTPIALQGVENPAETPAPDLTVTFLGCDQDWIGKKAITPDGEPDCQFRISGLGDRSIRQSRLTGPRNGIWLDRANPDRWLLKLEREGASYSLAFSYWTHGEHRLEVVFDDGSKQTIPFHVPVPGSPCFTANLDATESNVRVVRKQEPEYTEVMTSVLKNLLASDRFTLPD